MKFATKLSLGCITLLSCALCAAGLILTGKSFSGSLETTRAAMQELVLRQHKALQNTILLVTHSQVEAKLMCDTILTF